MNPLFPACAAAVLFTLPSPRLVSEPTGVFAIVEKAVLKPDDSKPTELELHGVFSVAAGEYGDHYHAARSGVLRFGLGSQPEEALKQWRDLQRHAGTGKVVAFSSRYEQAERGQAVRVVDASAAADKPAPYQPAFGLHVVENANYGPIRELMLLPRCEPEPKFAPSERRGRAARRVTLTCRNCAAAETDLAYVFSLQTSSGDRFASGVVAAGKGTTSWTADLHAEPGETITWSVHTVGAKVERAPCDSASFVWPASPANGR